MTEDDLSTFIMNSLIALLVSIYAFMQKWVKVNINIFNSDFFLIIIVIIFTYFASWK